MIKDNSNFESKVNDKVIHNLKEEIQILKTENVDNKVIQKLKEEIQILKTENDFNVVNHSKMFEEIKKEHDYYKTEFIKVSQELNELLSLNNKLKMQNHQLQEECKS